MFSIFIAEPQVTLDEAGDKIESGIDMGATCSILVKSQTSPFSSPLSSLAKHATKGRLFYFPFNVFFE